MRFYTESEEKAVKVRLSESHDGRVVFIKGRTPSKENTILSMRDGRICLYRLDETFIYESGIAVDENRCIKVKP